MQAILSEPGGDINKLGRRAARYFKGPAFPRSDSGNLSGSKPIRLARSALFASRATPITVPVTPLTTGAPLQPTALKGFSIRIQTRPSAASGRLRI